ncbi:MAG: HlyD family efflux transporter periplasmic adaptor subunit [Gemmatimonadetes bacterium]|nr:HlyD family efflux transporter periplasmic adaptor subunit [Gemmatimonadota bacterium]
MTGRDTGIYEALLEDLSDGVLVVDFQGSVRIANAAFCRMFGLDPAAAGRLFAELFLESEGLDEFPQAVLAAGVDRAGAERRIASVRIGGEQRSLSVTTTYLTAARDGGTERVAVIAVVSDLTEVRELRETELRMAKVIETQLGELQDAYRDLEARNEALSHMTGRVRAARIAAMVLVAGLILGIGAWQIRSLDPFSATAALDTASGAAAGDTPGALHTLTVEPAALRSTVALRGSLAPGRVVKVVSPLESHVSAVHASPGELVAEGDLLVEFDTGRLAAERRRAEVEHIKARDRLAALEDWDNGAEMQRARRSLRLAGIALDDAERTLARAAFLLDQGIVPASEHEEAQRGRERRKLDFEAAERELAAVAAKGGGEALRVARLELETARERLRSREAKLGLAELRVPIAGIVIAADGPTGKPLAKGRPVTQGELLASIADFERLSAVTSVDEVDVRKIAAGQRASISGPGFPGLRIEGTVERVSSQAEGGARRSAAPRFEIAVALDRLDADARGRLRVGMSAHVEIVVHSRPAALLVPIGAVEQDGGAAWVRVVVGDAVERRAVSLGLTTLDSVEVVGGLAAGDQVVLPR